MDDRNRCETRHEGRFDCQNENDSWECKNAEIRGYITSIHDKLYGHWVQ